MTPVEEAGRIAHPAVPSRAVQQPAVLRQRTVLGLPDLDVVPLQQEVGIGARLEREVQDRRRAHQPSGRHARHVVEALAGQPMHGCSLTACSPALLSLS